MKLILMVFGALAGTFYSGWLLAIPDFTPLNDYEVIDTYWGADDHGLGDVIGTRRRFDIRKAVFNRYLQGDRVRLEVTVYTGFVAKGGIRSFRYLTYNNKGIGLGDLLFSSGDWNPYRKGDNSVRDEHYGYDNAENGTLWDYAFALSDKRWDPSGTGALYELTAGNNTGGHILLSDHFMRGGTYRNGQEVAVDLTDESVESTGLTGNWSDGTDGDGDFVRFLLDVTGTDLATDSFGFHFGFLCANDVIEGDPPLLVPEPALLGLMMLGLGIFAWRSHHPSIASPR